MNYPSEMVEPAVWLGRYRNRIARISCRACHWSYDHPHLNMQSTEQILQALRQQWGLHTTEAHEGIGFRSFDKLMGRE